MNVLQLRLQAADSCSGVAGGGLEMFIDGQDLLELVRQVEVPFAQAEGCPQLAGA